MTIRIFCSEPNQETQISGLWEFSNAIMIVLQDKRELTSISDKKGRVGNLLSGYA